MGAPKFLVVTNEQNLGRDAPGVHAAFNELAEAGAVHSVRFSSWKPQGREDEAARDIRLVSEFAAEYDYAIVLSPRADSISPQAYESLDRAIGARTLAIWEGDAVTLQRLPPTVSMWFRRANAVFSQWGAPQPETILRAGAQAVFLLPATYCHVQFAEAELTPPSPEFERDVVMIANENKSLRRPFGMSGSAARRRLATLARRAGFDFELAGRGWPVSWEIDQMPFAQQSARIRQSRISINWDHAPSFADSSSNRLPISLISGRVHVTTQHPGMSWLPAGEIGLYQESSVAGVINRTRETLSQPDQSVFELGVANWKWARGRLSHRQSVRYQYSTLTGKSISNLPREPWAELPGPWTRSGFNKELADR